MQIIRRVWKVFVILFFGICLLVFFLATTANKNNSKSRVITDTQEQIRSAMDKGIAFLYQAQLSSGEFQTLCVQPESPYCIISSSPFITSFVLYSLRDIKDSRVDVMRERAIRFLYNLQGNGGIWEFSREMSKIIPPDVDNTSVASFALKDANIPFQDNTEAILRNRDAEGVFKTWFVEGNENAYARFAKEPRDCVVNANTAFYLSRTNANKQEVVSPLCSYINDAIVAGKNCAVYYPSRLTFYYTTARAYENGIACFADKKAVIIENILKTFNKESNSFGSDFDNALALNSLIVFGYQGSEVRNGLIHLLKAQNQDGSWKENAFFTYDGDGKVFARELTTALAIEALKRYKSVQKTN